MYEFASCLVRPSRSARATCLSEKIGHRTGREGVFQGGARELRENASPAWPVPGTEAEKTSEHRPITHLVASPGTNVDQQVAHSSAWKV